MKTLSRGEEERGFQAHNNKRVFGWAERVLFLHCKKQNHKGGNHMDLGNLLNGEGMETPEARMKETKEKKRK